VTPMSRVRCFVAMPFLAKLNYFYLYLQNYLEKNYNLQVERGDYSIATGPILDKIKRQIRTADLLIGDVSGSNPNVFYELGLADARDKKIILITSDPVEEAPVDIRHLELIQYDLARNVEFLSALNKAIYSTLVQGYASLYEKALTILQEFNSASGRHYIGASREQFQSNVMKWESRSGIPGDEDRIALTGFLLPKILENPTDIKILREVSTWLESLENSQ
jgi:hypothetical protein